MLSLGVLTGSVVVAVPALADHTGKPTKIKDVSGDANYVNDGGELTFGDTPTRAATAVWTSCTPPSARRGPPRG